MKPQALPTISSETGRTCAALYLLPPFVLPLRLDDPKKLGAAA